MDNSTEGVSLCAISISDILSVFEDKRTEYPSLFSSVKGYDLSEPFDHVPIDVYNDSCGWVEENLGREIGKTVFNTLQENKLIGSQPHPHEIMEALANVAKQMIKDPKGRGWEIVEKTPKSVLMRRTPTFNRTLQFGLLESLVFKSGVFSPLVELVSSTGQGDEYDKYMITWK